MRLASGDTSELYSGPGSLWSGARCVHVCVRVCLCVCVSERERERERKREEACLRLLWGVIRSDMSTRRVTAS